jgi:hypothetical protein
MLQTGGDTDVNQINAGKPPISALQTGNGHVLKSTDKNAVADYYLQFDIDDRFLFAAEPTSRIKIEIEYLDQGTDAFNIQYDAQSGGVDGDGRFKETATVHKTDSGKFQVAAFSVCDAYFANRDNGGDFRISDFSDGAEIIRRVTVTKLAATAGPQSIKVDSCGANPYDTEPDSDAIQACINQVCSGDTVVFTSGVRNPDYVGYLIDKTILLVHPDYKTNLTFRSTDKKSHALLKATADLRGFVVQLFARSVLDSPGLIDDITFRHLDIDSNRAERLCTGEALPGQEYPIDDGINDNWGAWLPECDVPGDPWCSPGSLYLSGGVDHSDPLQNYQLHPELWTTGINVRDVVLSNTECATAFFFQGAEFIIDSVTVDVAGDHVHGPGCKQTDPDEPEYAWADGITFLGPKHILRNNLVMDASDIGIVSFGGRNITIKNNIIRARPGNNGMFAGIAMHPFQLGNIGGLRVVGNQVINEGDQVCGGIHMGINLGAHTWGNGCIGYPSPAVYGNAEDCSVSAPPPEGALCGSAKYCQVWGHIPQGENLFLRDNTVIGAQVNYVIEGLDVMGKLHISGNESIEPRLTDWQFDQPCEYAGYVDSWGALDFVAHNPTIDGWVDQRIFCER